MRPSTPPVCPPRVSRWRLCPLRRPVPLSDVRSGAIRQGPQNSNSSSPASPSSRFSATSRSQVTSGASSFMVPRPGGAGAHSPKPAMACSSSVGLAVGTLGSAGRARAAGGGAESGCALAFEVLKFWSCSLLRRPRRRVAPQRARAQPAWQACPTTSWRGLVRRLAGCHPRAIRVGCCDHDVRVRPAEPHAAGRVAAQLLERKRRASCDDARFRLADKW